MINEMLCVNEMADQLKQKGIEKHRVMKTEWERK